MKKTFLLILIPIIILAQDVRNNLFKDIAVRSGAGYDIRAYGAVADDDASDRTYIQAAIDSCYNDGGGIVYFPGGTWDLIQDSVVVKSNITILGAGSGTIVKMTKTATATCEIFYITGDSNIVIENIQFLQDTTNSATYGVEHDHCINIREASENVSVSNCKFTCLGDGVYIGGTTSQPNVIDVNNNFFIGDSLEASNPPCARNGISVVYGKNIKISKNHFKGFQNVGCIDLEPNTDLTVENVIISNNTMINNGHGINLSGGATATIINVGITNNFIDRSGYATAKAGVYVQCSVDGMVSNVNIEDNEIKGDIDYTATYANIQVIGQSEGILVDNNICYNSPLNGIQISNGVSGITVSNNLCYNNAQNGIYFYGTTADETDNLSNDDFETSSDWSDSGTPTTSDTNSTTYLGGSYSYEIVTDAASEGIKQVFTIAAADTFSIFHVKAYCYISADGTQGTVDMSIGGERFELSGRSAKESNFDSTWQIIETFFRPTAADTLYILGSKTGMTFYVDSLTITQRNCINNATIIGNSCYGNSNSGSTYSGMRLTQVFNSIVSDNNVGGYQQPDYNSATQYRGLDLQGVFFSTIKGNYGINNTNVDLYMANVSYSDIETHGLSSMYVDRTKDYTENSFPSAKTLMFTEDSLASGITARPLQFSGHTARVRMPEAGRIIGLSAFLSSPATAGSMKIYPQIGNIVNANISARSYLYLTFTGSASGVYSQNLELANTSGYLEFQKGDYVTVAVYTDGSFATTATSYLTVQLLYE